MLRSASQWDLYFSSWAPLHLRIPHYWFHSLELHTHFCTAKDIPTSLLSLPAPPPKSPVSLRKETVTFRSKHSFSLRKSEIPTHCQSSGATNGRQGDQVPPAALAPGVADCPTRPLCTVLGNVIQALHPTAAPRQTPTGARRFSGLERTALTSALRPRGWQREKQLQSPGGAWRPRAPCSGSFLQAKET